MVNGPPEPAPNARLCLLTLLLFSQLCRKVHKSLATSQRSSATHSLWESERTSTSRKDSGSLQSRTCFIFYSQAMNTRNHPISVLATPFFLKDLENKRPTPHNPADFGKKKKKEGQSKKRCALKHSPLDQPAGAIKQIKGTLNPHPAFRPELTQPGHEHTHVPRTFSCQCCTWHPRSGSRTLCAVAKPFCWLSADAVDLTTSEPGKCKVDSQSKAGGNWRQEPREVLQGEALNRSQ